MGVERYFKIGRVGLHFWEEPVLSGKRGSGTVFFCGCNMRCVYCQNHAISRGGNKGVSVTDAQLAGLMQHLQDEGAHNINLVSPSHYARFLPPVLEKVKKSVRIPIVYNSGGYDRVEDIRALDGLIDIYLPDFKYGDNRLGRQYSGVGDYVETAYAAVSEMRRRQPKDVFSKGIMRRGVIVRHLILPGEVENSRRVLKMIADIDRSLYVSLMAQYFPAGGTTDKFPALSRRITQAEYDAVRDAFFAVGLSHGFTQDIASAIEDYVPDFDTEKLKDLIEKTDKKTEQKIDGKIE